MWDPRLLGMRLPTHARRSTNCRPDRQADPVGRRTSLSVRKITLRVVPRCAKAIGQLDGELQRTAMAGAFDGINGSVHAQLLIHRGSDRLGGEFLRGAPGWTKG